MSPCGREDVLTPEIERRTTHGRVDGDRWTDSTNGRGVGYARLGERILAALEIHHAAPFGRRDYAAASRNRTPRIPGPPRQTRMSPSLGLRNRRRMSVAMPSFLLLFWSLFRHGSPMHHPLKTCGYKRGRATVRLLIPCNDIQLARPSKSLPTPGRVHTEVDACDHYPPPCRA